jgi:hypothetical protein
LPGAQVLHPLTEQLARALVREDRPQIQRLCQKIASSVADALDAPPIRVKVLAARPTGSWGELHGLYVPTNGKTTAAITVWMRTARRQQIVAFKSFLRTLLHELCHHLDYEHFGLDDSFHTEGFYQRESSLFHQIVKRNGTILGKKQQGKGGRGALKPQAPSPRSIGGSHSVQRIARNGKK